MNCLRILMLLVLLPLSTVQALELSGEARWYVSETPLWPGAYSDIADWEASLSETTPSRAGHQYWVVFHVPPSTPSGSQVFMPYSAIAESIEVRLLSQNGETQRLVAGEATEPAIPFSYALPFQLHSDDRYVLIARVESNYRYAPLKFRWLDQPTFDDIQGRRIATIFICLGGGLALALYNLFVALGTRSRAELFYAGFALSWVFGWSQVLFVPQSVFGWQSPALHWVGFLLLPLFSGLFFIYFLDLKKHMPRIANAIVIVGIISVFLAPVGALWSQVGFYLATVLTGTTMILGVIAGVIRLRQGFYLARYFLLAFVMLLVPNTLNNVVNLGFLYMPGVDNYIAGLIGTTLDALLLSLAMSLKIRLILQENQRLNSELEAEVFIRTEELETAKANLERANDDLQQLAESDPLTGLPNRRALEKSLAREHDKFQRRQRPFSLIVIDLDDFKRVNDQHGHDIGDRVLRHVGHVLHSALRREDEIFRLGGEEFCLLAQETQPNVAKALAERIRAKLANEAFNQDAIHISITASVGVASIEPGMDTVTLFQRADNAMYIAKHGGKNQVQAHAEI